MVPSIIKIINHDAGLNSIVMYGVSLLAGLLKSNSALLNLAVSALNIIVTAGCAPLVDKLGRKTCLLNSLTGMGISSLLLAIGIMKSISVLSAVAVLLFVSSFALGLGPVPFILASELVGPDAVGATQSIALAANWIATFAVAQFFPLASEKLHGKVYFIFAALSAFFFVFISWFVPETKGKKNADEEAKGNASKPAPLNSTLLNNKDRAAKEHSARLAYANAMPLPLELFMKNARSRLP